MHFLRHHRPRPPLLPSFAFPRKRRPTDEMARDQDGGRQARRREGRCRADHLSKCVRAANSNPRSEVAVALQNHEHIFENTDLLNLARGASLPTNGRKNPATTMIRFSSLSPPSSPSSPRRTLTLPRVKTLNRGCRPSERRGKGEMKCGDGRDEPRVNDVHEVYSPPHSGFGFSTKEGEEKA